MPLCGHHLGPDGPTLPVLVSLTGGQNASLITAGQPVPPPLLLTGLVDTGTNITGVSLPLIQKLPARWVRDQETYTASGKAWVGIYEVSLGIPRLEAPLNPLLVLSEVEVMGLPHPLEKIEVILGRDVLSHLLLIWDGQRGEFILGD